MDLDLLNPQTPMEELIDPYRSSGGKPTKSFLVVHSDAGTYSSGYLVGRHRGVPLYSIANKHVNAYLYNRCFAAA